MMYTFDFLSAVLAEGVSQGCFPSAVAAVGVKDQLLYVGAAGDANIDTRFDMASMTKILGPTMLALAALEEGLLTLDDTVSRFFDAPSDKAAITIRQLMTHTGGFTPFFWLSEEADDPDNVVECILGHPLEFAPDGTPLYSCIGYILLGKILEKVYGGRLDILAKERVFDPLHMNNTCYNPTGGNIAPTEVDPKTGVAWCGIVHDENARYLRGISANAGIFSDIHDNIRFASMLACGGKGFLAPATLSKAIQNYTEGRGTHRGLGFHLAGVPGSFMGDLFPANAYGHTGFTGTSLAIDPATGLYAVLLSNRVHPTRENDKHLRFRRVFHNQIYANFSRQTKSA